MKRKESGSLLPKGLRERLMVSFSLMSVVPLLVLGYVTANYVFPHMGVAPDLSLVVCLAIGIACLGFLVARSLVLPVVRLASQVKAAAEGELKGEFEVKGSDEIGTLSAALNQLTDKVRENMGQLRVYGEQTKHLNLEINRRMLTLSHLLQVSNLITQSAKVEEIISFILEKLTQIEGAELNCFLEVTGDPNLFLVRAIRGVDGLEAEALLNNAKLAAPWFQKALQKGQALVIDEKNPLPQADPFVRERMGMTNAVCQPLLSMGHGIGWLICANRKPDFTFTEDSLELLRIFAKQLAIAIENDLLTRRTEELKLVDELTGLYNAGYMRSRLEEEVRRAVRYHRPCSLVVFSLDDFQQFEDLYGGLAGEEILRQVADLLKGAVSEVDRVGRLGAEEFALILPERNKREAIELGEEIRARIEKRQFTHGPQRLSHSMTASVGLSENPLDGSTGEELLGKAMEAVRSAKHKTIQEKKP
ncbi:MAG: sensor domain-containing diguanylate cyclase [Candidatus Omnitrophica bacterium]|nr:sensor domain-containing diguanylate cyclase [Candidatus Omnitrophota bacterium]